MLRGPAPQMRTVFETDLGLVESEKIQGRGKSLDLNKKPIFLSLDFETEEMCSFQEKLNASQYGQSVIHLQDI